MHYAGEPEVIEVPEAVKVLPDLDLAHTSDSCRYTESCNLIGKVQTNLYNNY